MSSQMVMVEMRTSRKSSISHSGLVIRLKRANWKKLVRMRGIIESVIVRK